MFRNIVSVYSEESLALRPDLMLEDYILKDGIGRLSRNVGKKILIPAVLWPRIAQFPRKGTY